MTDAIDGIDAIVLIISVSLGFKSTIVWDLMLGLSETLRPEKLIHPIRRHFDRSGEIF